MNPFSAVDHVALAVRDLERVRRFYVDGLGLRDEGEERLEDRRLRVGWLAGRGLAIELLAPEPDESIVTKFLDRRGEGVHHVAFRVDDLAAAVTHARGVGLEPTEEGPRPGARGKLVQFLRPRGTFGLLVELCQSRSLDGPRGRA